MDSLSLNDWIGRNVVEGFAKVGVAPDQARFLFCMLLAYPLGLIFSALPNNVTLKHSLSLGIGLWFAWFFMEWQILHSLISSTVVYLMICFLPRNLQHKVVFIFSMGYISLSHIYRMYTDYLGWSMDFTGPQMILTIKLTTLACDYFDGSLSAEELEKHHHKKKMHLNSIPSPLEYYGYIYFFGGFLAGPAFNFKEYVTFVDLSMFSKTNAMPSLKERSLASLKIVLQSCLLAVGVQLSLMYPLAYARTENFYNHPFFYRLFYIWMGASLQRFPYYFAWFLSEGSCNLAGIGWSGYDQNGVSKWERAKNVKILSLELAQNFKEITESWNIRTDKWLKHYIYERAPKFQVALTFFISALWHGFYPGYYLSFMSATFIINAMRIIRRNIRPHFLESDGQTPKSSKIFYDFVCTFATSFMLNYNMTPFCLLEFTASWKAWFSLYFIGHFVLFAVVATALLVGPPKKVRSAGMVSPQIEKKVL